MIAVFCVFDSEPDDNVKTGAAKATVVEVDVVDEVEVDEVVVVVPVGGEYETGAGIVVVEVVVVVVVGTEVVGGSNVVAAGAFESRGTAKYRTGVLVVKHFPVIGHLKKPVSLCAQAKNLFGLFGFAATVPLNKHLPEVAKDRKRVEVLMHICGATLVALHRMENSILGLHPPFPGSRKSEVSIPTHIEIMGTLV